MGLVKLSEVEPGMTIGADVRDRGGRILLGAGAEVTEKHLSIFRKWGVAELDIEGAEGTPPPLEESQIDPEVLDEARDAAWRHLRHNDRGHPAVVAVHGAVSLRIARRVLEESHVR
jgi:hypothetical protein